MPLSRTVAIGAVVLTVALAAGGCASPRGQGTPDPQLRGQWQLANVSDATGTLSLAGQHISLTIDRDTSTTGRSSCNDYTARILGSADELSVTTSHPSVAHCATTEQKKLETRYLDDLGRIHRATVTGGVLELSAAGITLSYERTLELPIRRFADETWVLSWLRVITASINPVSGLQNISYADDPAATASLRFSNDGTVTAVTGCRHISARYHQDAGEVIFTQLELLRAGPCDAQAKTVDSTMLSAFRSGFSCELIGGILNTTASRAGFILVYAKR